MKKEKWLLKEIDAWQQLSLVNPETAEILKERYSPKKNTNFLIVLFSIIGALLIGTGIILIGAKNWYDLPLFLRVTIAFLPLAVSQALAVYVLKFKYESIAWREAVAILVTTSIFAVVALVGQIFHLSGDFGTYVLTCGLLSLPMIYILDSATPLFVYYWTILNWAALDHSAINAPILLVLFALGALFVFLKSKQTGARLLYMMWLTVIAGFVAVLIMGIMLETSLLLIVLCYFALMLSIEELPELLLIPFKTVGIIGGVVTTAILTYRGMWEYMNDSVSIGGSIMALIMLIAALFFAIRAFKRDRLKFSFVAILILVCVTRYIWAAFDLDIWPYEFIFMIFSNIVLFSIGVGFIVHGAKNTSLLTTNIGMASICALIIMRFFDSGMDFFWRGVVFLVLGIIFLLVNLKVLHVKKQAKQEVAR